MTEFLIPDREKVSLDEVFLSPESATALRQLLQEFRHLEALAQYNLPVSHKVLLQGASGCGKTMTAKAVAHALSKNIYILNLSTFISSRIGETAQNLKVVFDKAAKDGAVLFLDEFDQIGKTRTTDDRDVGEMRRLVNTLLQLLDYFPKKALLICATNHPEMLDPELLRRFQVTLTYELPDRERLDAYYDQLLAAFPEIFRNIPRKYEISFAEAKDHAHTLLKARIIAQLQNQTA